MCVLVVLSLPHRILSHSQPAHRSTKLSIHGKHDRREKKIKFNNTKNVLIYYALHSMFFSLSFSFWIIDVMYLSVKIGKNTRMHTHCNMCNMSSILDIGTHCSEYNHSNRQQAARWEYEEFRKLIQLRLYTVEFFTSHTILRRLFW